MSYNEFLSYEGLKKLWEIIKSTFVAKEEGKGLSSKDFTQEYINKIEYPETVGDFPKSADVIDINDNENTYIRGKDIIPELQNKVNKTVAFGLETNGLCAHSIFNGYMSGNNGALVTAGEYVPLFLIESKNLGKAQLFFTLYSRDSVNTTYTASYYFSSRSGQKYNLLLNDFTASNTNFITKDSIGFIKINNNVYLIVRKVLKGNGTSNSSFEDPFVVSVEAKEVWDQYANITCFTSFETEKEHPDSPETKIVFHESISEYTYDGITYNINENYIPCLDTNKYVLPTATSSTLGGVKSGGDITIQSDGTMQVNDDSHNHVINNIDGLQSALNKKRNGLVQNLKHNSNQTFDWNDIITPGSYTIDQVSTLAPNAPNTGSYGTLVVEISNGRVVQTYYPDYISLNHNLCIRKKVGEQWGSWNYFTTLDRIDQTYATKTENSNKVDKVDGKGLSTNDYTDAEKTKLEGIASGAEVNTIVAIQRNGTAITPTDRVVNILVPVKTSELNNDSTYQTEADVAETIVGVKLDLASGIITLTRKNGTTFTLDLPTEKIIKSGRYDSDTEEIVLVLEDESEIRFSASELIDEYYADESTLELYTDTTDGNKKKFRLMTAYKNKIDGSEQTTNKTASVSASSTETQYPTAKAVYNAVKDLATKVQTFTQASTRANIESGETISTIFGKIRKWFADLKAVAFSGSYNDLTDKPTIGNLASLEPNSSEESFADTQKIIASPSNGVWGGTSYSKTALMMWNYINSKIGSVLGLTASNYSGIAVKADGLRGGQRSRNNNSRYVEIGRITVPTGAHHDKGFSILVKGQHNSNLGDCYIFNVELRTGSSASTVYSKIYCTMASRTNYNEVLAGELTSTHLILYLDCVLQSYASWAWSILNDADGDFIPSSGYTYVASIPSSGGTKVAQKNNMLANKDGSGNTITSTYLKLSGGTMTGNVKNKEGNYVSLIPSKQYSSYYLQFMKITYVGSNLDIPIEIRLLGRGSHQYIIQVNNTNSAPDGVTFYTIGNSIGSASGIYYKYDSTTKTLSLMFHHGGGGGWEAACVSDVIVPNNHYDKFSFDYTITEVSSTSGWTKAGMTTFHYAISERAMRDGDGKIISDNYTISTSGFTENISIHQFWQELRTKPSKIGSVLLGTTTGIGSQIKGGWYNFIFMTHYVNSGSYGSILITPMTVSNARRPEAWILQIENNTSSITNVLRLSNQQGGYYDVLEINDSNLSTYYTKSDSMFEILTIPLDVDTVVFNTTNAIVISAIQIPNIFNGKRITLIGQSFSTSEHLANTSTDGRFSEYLYEHRYGQRGGNGQSSNDRYTYEQYLYFKGIWYSKGY